MPIPLWPQYADHPLAPKCRSRPGSNMPVGDRWNTRVFLVNSQEQTTGSGVLLRHPCAKFFRWPKTPRSRQSTGR